MKKTVIFIDLLPNQGHFEFNNGIIELFTKYYNVTILSPSENYLKIKNKNNVNELHDKKIVKILKTKNLILKFVKLFFHFASINQSISNKDYDFIYILTFNNSHLFLFLLTIKLKLINKTYFNVHNNFNNIARKTNHLERLLFSSYKDKINFVCNSSLIIKTLKNHEISINKLHMLRSPMIIHEILTKNKSYLNYKYDSILISSSNDPYLIEKFIDYDKKTKYLSNNKLMVLARSNIIDNNSSIETIPENWIPRTKLLELLESTWSVGLFFYKDYQLRTSSSLIEALSNGKIVFANKTDITDYYAKMYPNIVIIVSSELHFFEKLKCYKEKLSYLSFEKDFELFNLNNSNETIESDLKMIFENHMSS